jgi:hypothetical protein
MAKKEERLSPKAKRLLDGARKKFSHNPEKAVEYLESVKPEDLNLYDRQKIGREILAREKRILVGRPNAISEYVAKVSEEYDLNNDSPQKYGEEKYVGIVKADIGFRYAASIEQSPNFSKDGVAVKEYTNSGDLYAENGRPDRAVSSYSRALKILNERHYVGAGRQIHQLEKKIARLRKGDAGRREFSARVSQLEKTAATTAIIGLIGGIFFFSNNITGNVIGIPQTSSIIGLGFLLVALVGTFFWAKGKK